MEGNSGTIVVVSKRISVVCNGTGSVVKAMVVVAMEVCGSDSASECGIFEMPSTLSVVDFVLNIDSSLMVSLVDVEPSVDSKGVVLKSGSLVVFPMVVAANISWIYQQ